MKNKKDNWILIVFILTFILSIIFSFVSNSMAANFNDLVLFIILLLTISIGILFDVIGTSSITAKESSFHALNSKKIKGAKQCVFIVKNGNKISSLCNDIVGDVCGIISGSIGAILSISLSSKSGINSTLVSIILAALISSLTVGGKAIFKKVAIKNADKIVFKVGKLITLFNIK